MKKKPLTETVLERLDETVAELELAEAKVARLKRDRDKLVRDVRSREDPPSARSVAIRAKISPTWVARLEADAG